MSILRSHRCLHRPRRLRRCRLRRSRRSAQRVLHITRPIEIVSP
jgi:hypothetical protein